MLYIEDISLELSYIVNKYVGILKAIKYKDVTLRFANIKLLKNMNNGYPYASYEIIPKDNNTIRYCVTVHYGNDDTTIRLVKLKNIDDGYDWHETVSYNEY